MRVMRGRSARVAAMLTIFPTSPRSLTCFSQTKSSDVHSFCSISLAVSQLKGFGHIGRPESAHVYIAKFLGSHYLRVRTDRLLLFKDWFVSLTDANIDYRANKPFNRFQVAQLVAFEDLTITNRSPQRFLEAPYSAHTLVQSCVRRISIEVGMIHKRICKPLWMTSFRLKTSNAVRA
jgi:hypothetical protein